MAKTANPDEIRRILHEAARLAKSQFWYRGEHWVTDQVEEVIEK